MLPVVGAVLEEIRTAPYGQSTKGTSATLKVATLNLLDYLVANGMKMNGVTDVDVTRGRPIDEGSADMPAGRHTLTKAQQKSDHHCPNISCLPKEG